MKIEHLTHMMPMIRKYSMFLIILLELVATPLPISSFHVAMKVVESPMAYGFNNDLVLPITSHDNLVLQVSPSNFSGPRQLQQLMGNCYNLTDAQYQYTFCPFSNVTQFELANRWNAYQGVLGVWREWNIVNNTFASMRMLKGDQCGSSDRSVEVFLECGTANEIKDVVEPTKCQYHLHFSTPLVCHHDAVLVYPRLSPVLQNEWDELETELANEQITLKGYEEGLNRIFIKAGYKLEKTTQSDRNDSFVIDSGDLHSHSNFTECLKEVDELKREIEALKLLLELNTVSGRQKN